MTASVTTSLTVPVAMPVATPVAAPVTAPLTAPGTLRVATKQRQAFLRITDGMTVNGDGVRVDVTPGVRR